MSRVRLRLVASAIALLFLGIVADKSALVADLTVNKSLTLTTQSRDVARAVRRPTRITAVVARNEAGRAEAAALLGRYRRLNHRITWRVLDPRDAPGELQRLGIEPSLDRLAVATEDQIERGPTITEQDITSALARAVRGRARTACFTTGHGETSTAATVDGGLSLAAGLLRDNGYRLVDVDLVTAAPVPPSCEALVLANPTAPLGAAGDVLARWLAAGGRALVLADPVSSVDLSPLLRPYGIGVSRGVVIEGDPDARFPDDPLTPVVRRYRSGNPAVRGMAATFFPGVQGLIVDADGETEGLVTVELAETTNKSYLEREPAGFRFDEGVDLPGPVVIVAAADLSANIGETVRRTRLLVVGDVDFATNTFVNEAGNSRLFIRSLDWLTLEEDLVTVTANLPPLRSLHLTPSRARYLRLLAAVVVPLLFLLAGAMVWAVRRRW